MPLKETQKTKKRARKTHRCKLLLDEGLAPRAHYKQINRLHDVKHIKHDLNKPRCEDEELYEIAHNQERIVATFNTCDFRKLIRPSKPTIFSLSPNLTKKEIDTKLLSKLKTISLSQMKGKLFSFTKLGIRELPVTKHRK